MAWRGPRGHVPGAVVALPSSRDAARFRERAWSGLWPRWRARHRGIRTSPDPEGIPARHPDGSGRSLRAARIETTGQALRPGSSEEYRGLAVSACQQEPELLLQRLRRLG